METDFAIIGGGIVGLSIAYGLLKRGKRVQVFDEGDMAIRASRGNFGLVWVQSKGLEEPAYAKWSRRSARAYRGFSEELQEISGQKLNLIQDGGYSIHMNEDTLYAAQARYENLKVRLEGDFPFEIMGRNALQIEEPNIGPDVAGAIYCPDDGHINPLLLLQSLVIAVKSLGGEILTNAKVHGITPTEGGFMLNTGDKVDTGGNMDTKGHAAISGKVVLSAGLGAMTLGPQLGFKAPIRPQQGQILITEKIPKLMNRPNVEVRQVNEGGVQIGASKAEVGLNDQEDLTTAATLAAKAVRMFPKLAQVQFVRCWAALRIMSPDGLPIYQQSTLFPGAYFVTCHSGITLAAAHADFLCSWLTKEDNAPDLSAFSETRF